MTWDPALDELLTETVYFSTASAQTRYGVKTFSTAQTSARARIVVRQSEVRTAQGQTVMSAATVWVKSTGAISAEDRITLPAGILPTSQPPILSVERYPDETGPHHHKLSLGF